MAYCVFKEHLTPKFFFSPKKNLHALVSISLKKILDLVKSLNFYALLKCGKSH